MNSPKIMPYHNATYLTACAERLGREMTIEETAKALDCLAHESGREIRQIESLMFGGILQDTKEDGLAWRVFKEVMALKKERDELRRVLDSQHDNAESIHPDTKPQDHD
jgi:hypothetical protein